jgi:hypothetical protein
VETNGESTPSSEQSLGTWLLHRIDHWGKKKIGGRRWRRLSTSFWASGLGILLVLSLPGCGNQRSTDEVPIEQVLPSAPGNTNFGALYPHVNALLESGTPDVLTATRDTVAWANKNLDGFALGGCAPAQIVQDAEFADSFGRTTLGVTLPWMQIYVRDGRRTDEGFLWKDATLFVSTLLHEFTHAKQRAEQAIALLGTRAECNSAKHALVSKRGIWNSGFMILQGSPYLGEGFNQGDQTILYQWISPIHRARDEIDASVRTVRWMNEHPDELNAYTMGGANNWAYGVQYLNQLRVLASSTCFSADNDTYQSEKRIYEVELPQFIAALAQHEHAMNVFFKERGLPGLPYSLSEMNVAPAPSGRDGHRCQTSALSELPKYPVEDPHFNGGSEQTVVIENESE